MKNRYDDYLRLEFGHWALIISLKEIAKRDVNGNLPFLSPRFSFAIAIAIAIAILQQTMDKFSLKSLKEISLPTRLAALALLIYAILKWKDLFLPMFWDEIGVYGPGILYMVDHGVGMLPANLPSILSRGHPLFFYALFSAWAKVFGSSLFVLHSLALMISLGMFGSVYYIGKKLIGNWTAFWAMLWLMVQGALFAQSALALPEILLSLLILWSLYFCVQKAWWQYAIVASVAMLTKESAIVVLLACGLWYGIELLRQQKKVNWKAIIGLFAPIGIYGLFLLIQKQTHGWYFFPYHVELMNFDLKVVWRKFLDYSFWLFVAQGRWMMSLVLPALAIYGLLQKQRKVSSVVLLLIIFSLGFLAFSALNAYMNRYVCALMPVLAILFAIGLNSLWEKQKLFIGAAALVIAIPMLFFSQDEFRYDVDINYRKYLSAQQELTDFIRETVPPQKAFLANFPLYNGFQDPRFGFVSDTMHNSATVREHDSLVYRAIIVPPSYANSLKKEGELIKKVERDFIKGEVFVKK